MEAAEDRPAGRERGPRGPYREKLRDYGPRYQCKERTIKRWVALGREQKDPCPLDDPEAMMAWWSRTSPNRAPDGLVAALIEWRKSRPATETPPAPEENAPDLPDAGHVPSAPAPPSTTDQLEHIDPATLGLEHELGRLELLAARLSKEAHKPGQAKSYLDAVARMTATSSKLREEMEKQRRLIPRLEAEAAILEFHDPIQRGIRDLYVKWCETTGLPPSPERLEAWNREIDVLFSRFGEEVFR